RCGTDLCWRLCVGLGPGELADHVGDFFYPSSRPRYGRRIVRRLAIVLYLGSIFSTSSRLPRKALWEYRPCILGVRVYFVCSIHFRVEDGPGDERQDFGG